MREPATSSTGTRRCTTSTIRSACAGSPPPSAASSGATAQLAFCPVAGVVVERASAHASGESFYLQVPMWGGVDSPGRLVQYTKGALAADLGGAACGDGTALHELGGFYRETVAFLDAVAAGREPSPSLRASRQSVAIAEQIRERRSEYHA